MPETKIIKSNISKATSKPGPDAVLRVRAPRNHRASSCSRLPQQRHERCGRSDRSDRGDRGARRAAPDPRCEARARSNSAAPGAPELRRNPSGPLKDRPAGTQPLQGRGRSQGPGEQRSVRPDSQSHPAFTVIPPDPRKRREIQRKAEAELAALEELRLSRAMAYVSIDPSTVGGCMSLEEVRMKQQQEMVQAKRKHKPIRKEVLMEQTPVLTT